MLKISNGVFVEPKEVCGIENDFAYSYYGKGYQKGVVVTLRCGRKIYVPELNAEKVHEIIFGNKKGS